MTTNTMPTKKEQVKLSIMKHLSENGSTDQTFLIKECLTIAGKTTITDAIKELEKEGHIEKHIVVGLICWDICAINPVPDTVDVEETPEPVIAPVIVPTPIITVIATPTLKEKLMDAGKKVRSKNNAAKTKEKIERPRSQYGRLLSSAVGVIDSLLLTGTTTEDEIINAIQKKFPQKTKEQIINRMKSHLRQLKREGVEITKTNGSIKIKN